MLEAVKMKNGMTVFWVISNTEQKEQGGELVPLQKTKIPKKLK